MRGFDGFDLGALTAVTVCLFIEPIWITPIVWAIMFMLLNNFLEVIKK